MRAVFLPLLSLMSLLSLLSLLGALGQTFRRARRALWSLRDPWHAGHADYRAGLKVMSITAINPDRMSMASTTVYASRWIRWNIGGLLSVLSPTCWRLPLAHHLRPPVWVALAM